MTMLAFTRNIGGPEVLIVLVVVLLLFGTAKEFRKGVEDGAEGDESSRATLRHTRNSTRAISGRVDIVPKSGARFQRP